MTIISRKICLIGDFSVGKTSLVRRFVEGNFSDKYLTTVGVKISRKPVTIDSNSQQVNLLVWDIEGNTKQKAIPANYLKGATGAIIVGDLTRVNTLDSIKNHLQLFSDINPQGTVIVALNKQDLVTPEKLGKLQELHNYNSYQQVANTYLTSAKTGDCVNLMFEKMAVETTK